jgi:hypothetical protein
MEGKNEWETAKLDELNELWEEFHESIVEYNTYIFSTL